MSATPVNPLASGVIARCDSCGRGATWQVGLRHRACTEHVVLVLAVLHQVVPRHLPLQRSET